MKAHRGLGWLSSRRHECTRGQVASDAQPLAERVIAYLRSHGGDITAREIADRFDVEVTSVAAPLRRRVARGELACRVEGRAPRRTAYYRLGPKA